MPSQESSVAFTADVSQFTQNINKMRDDIKLINSQFEVSASEMDDWSSSSEGLEAKLKQLNGVLDAEKKKLADMEKRREEYIATLDKNKKALADLEAEYKRVVASEGASSTNAKKLAKQKATLATAITKNEKAINNENLMINKQKVVVNNTQKSLDKYSQELEDVGKKTKDASDATGGFSKAMKGIGGGLAKGIVAIGAAAAGAATSFLALAESTREYRTALARLETNADQAGMSTDAINSKLKELNQVTGDTDSNVEALSNLLQAGFTESNMSGAIETLSDAVIAFPDTLKVESLADSIQESMQQMEMGSNSTGQYAELLERLGYNLDTVTAEYGGLSTEEEKQAYLLGLVNDKLGGTSEAYKEQNKNLIDAADAQFDLNQKMSELGDMAEPITTLLKNGLVTVLDMLSPLISQVAEAFEKLLSGDIMGGVAVLGEVFINLKQTISEAFIGIINGISEILPQALPKVVEFLGQLIQQFIEFAPTLLNAAIQLFGAIIQALPPTIISLIDQLPLILNSIVSSLNEMIPALLDAAITFLGSIIEALPTVIQRLAEAIPQILTTITNFIQTNIPVLLEKFGELLGTLVKAIPNLLVSLAKQLPTIIGAIVDFITTNLPTLLNAAIKLFNQIVAAIPKLLVNLQTKLPTIITKIVQTLLANAPKIATMAFDLFMNIVAAIPKMIIELAKSLPDIVDTIIDAFGDPKQLLYDIGSDIVKGLWDGIKSLGDWLKKKAESLAGWLPKWVKEKLGIASPSKVFAEIGGYSAEGLGVGFEDGMKDVRKTIENNVDFSDLDTNVGTFRASASGSVGGNNKLVNSGESKVVNLNYVVNSPKALNRFEIYQQAKRMKAAYSI